MIDAAIDCQVAENAARARRLAAVVEFYRREDARGGQRSPGDPSFFVLTALASTSTQFAAALSV
ncbi:MAG TPA: hypothetical protein VFG63_16525, partial [Nocardioidaceae bacterium]|nr:hypothetical protein [Nocardioidaceae bacterium]